MCLLFFTVRCSPRLATKLSLFSLLKSGIHNAQHMLQLSVWGAWFTKCFFAFRLSVIVPYAKVFHLLHHA